MQSTRLENLFSHADDCLQRGLLDQAINLCREILTEDPDYGQAHSLLAVALANQKRWVAAEYEAELGLALEPLHPWSHYAISVVRVSQKRVAEGLDHVLIARELDPEDDDYPRLQASILESLGRDVEAEEAYRRALELGPDNPKNHSWYGLALLSLGRTAEAERYARQALSLAPDDREALLLMGSILLSRGEATGAREHALWVLQNDASDLDGLKLLCGIKARESFLLGWWWRYSTWIGQMGDARSVFILVGAAIFVRFAVLVLGDVGFPDLATLLDRVWLGVIAYTWVGPAWFERALEKEIGSVTLSDQF